MGITTESGSGLFVKAKGGKFYVGDSVGDTVAGTLDEARIRYDEGSEEMKIPPGYKLEIILKDFTSEDRYIFGFRPYGYAFSNRVNQLAGIALPLGFPMKIKVFESEGKNVIYFRDQANQKLETKFPKDPETKRMIGVPDGVDTGQIDDQGNTVWDFTEQRSFLLKEFIQFAEKLNEAPLHVPSNAKLVAGYCKMLDGKLPKYAKASEADKRKFVKSVIDHASIRFISPMDWAQIEDKLSVLGSWVREEIGDLLNISGIQDGADAADVVDEVPGDPNLPLPEVLDEDDLPF
jgi:hypothetical protein